MSDIKTLGVLIPRPWRNKYEHQRSEQHEIEKCAKQEYDAFKQNEETI
jgi:uncharacterized membrane-anchored protein YhcB (DUF1043 family)